MAASLNASCNLSSENSSANNNRASKDGCCEFVVKGSGVTLSGGFGIAVLFFLEVLMG